MEMLITRGDFENLKNLFAKIAKDPHFTADEAIKIEVKEDGSAWAIFDESNDLYSGGLTYSLAARSNRFGVRFGWIDRAGDFKGNLFDSSKQAAKWGISNL